MWSYRDSVLQSTQLTDGKRLLFNNKEQFTSILNLSNNFATRLEKMDERIDNINSSNAFVVVSDKQSIKQEFWWKSYHQKCSYLVSLRDGSRRLIDSGTVGNRYWFSPRGEYLLYYSYKSHSYISLNLSTGKSRDISKCIPTSLVIDLQGVGTSFTSIGIAGWVYEDKSVLLYDEFDIWKVDLENITPPLNITNGYGRKNSIKLRISSNSQSDSYKSTDTLILCGFNTSTKYNGFYSKLLLELGDPELLTMTPSSLSYHHGADRWRNGEGRH